MEAETLGSKASVDKEARGRVSARLVEGAWLRGVTVVLGVYGTVRRGVTVVLGV